ncbi:MAG: deoxyribodipyrimidine photo-lyase [Thermoanaerobaculia bacterium]
MSLVLCWFQRNLRVDDNLPLDAALRAGDAVVPVFVLDPCREEPSPAARALQREALIELAERLLTRGSRLILRRGTAEHVLLELVRTLGADGVFTHADHEPAARLQHARVRASLGTLGVPLHASEDLLLVPSAALRTQGGKPFTVFTPFSRRWLEADKSAPVPPPVRIPSPETILSPSFPSLPAGEIDPGGPLPPDLPRGGTRAARQRWTRFREDALVDYGVGRDRPDREGTSRLSLDLRPGVLGIRRLYAELRALQKSGEPQARASIETFIKELAWREFFAGVLDAFPAVATTSFRPEFDRFDWVSGEDETRLLSAWAEGSTGYPIVDAGMRQLSREGWMHNRVRMIVASFLTKDLLVTWRRGEEFFRSRLADADLASNNGGWQWAAGSGCDAQPFFRIFNPVKQGERFDPEGLYVRRHVSELAESAARGPAIHSPWDWPDPPAHYPRPLVDHAQARARALAAFARLRASEA